ncbi:GNAT family N-acetyltransferase [Isoptericola sp. NPDC019693]|uniref:GNAT family N-acetyltransferase n=1 Tax=Isoptericola sp. NPDC019693 TaxID=3364009 RepID=UPI0037A4D108
MTLALDGHGLAPVTDMAGASLPDRWARHPVVVAEHAYHGWDASHAWWDDEAFLVRLRWRERTDGARPFAVEADGTGASLLGVGTPGAAARLLLRARDELRSSGDAMGVRRASLPRGTHAALSVLTPGGVGAPAPFDRAPGGAWDWFGTTVAPGEQPGQDRVTELVGPGSGDEVARALATANPHGELSPHEPRARWWGWRGDDGVLRGVAGASRRVPGQPWVLGSIGTDPAWRGRGIAAAVTAAATRAGLEEVAMVTLGMYAHNDAARRVYARLGFTLAQRFESWRPTRAARPAPSGRASAR